MDPDAFAVLLGCAGFVLGLGCGLFLATTRTKPLPKGKPISDQRMRKLWVVNGGDPLLDHGPNLEHQHPTIYPRRGHR